MLMVTNTSASQSADSLTEISGEWATGLDRCGKQPDRDDNIALTIEATGKSFSIGETSCPVENVERRGKLDFSVEADCDLNGEPDLGTYRFQVDKHKLVFGSDGHLSSYFRCPSK